MGDLSEFTQEQKDRLMQIIRDNKTIFSKNDEDIGCTNVIEHDIITTNEIPIKQPDKKNPTTITARGEETSTEMA